MRTLTFSSYNYKSIIQVISRTENKRKTAQYRLSVIPWMCCSFCGLGERGRETCRVCLLSFPPWCMTFYTVPFHISRVLIVCPSVLCYEWMTQLLNTVPLCYWKMITHFKFDFLWVMVGASWVMTREISDWALPLPGWPGDLVLASFWLVWRWLSTTVLRRVPPPWSRCSVTEGEMIPVNSRIWTLGSQLVALFREAVEPLRGACCLDEGSTSMKVGFEGPKPHSTCWFCSLLPADGRKCDQPSACFLLLLACHASMLSVNSISTELQTTGNPSFAKLLLAMVFHDRKAAKTF